MDRHASLHRETLACWLLATALPAGLAALLHVLCHHDLEAHVAEPLPFAVLYLGAVGVLLIMHRDRGPASPVLWQAEVANSLEAAARVVVSMVRTDTQEDVKRALQVK